MALPRIYADEACSMAKSLEIVGERWSLLIVRDAFYGVRRFSDFAAHLNIPRAVLTDRLRFLVEAQVLRRVLGTSGRDEYELTDKGRALWPVIRGLIGWGDEHYASAGPRRVFRHVDDEGLLDTDQRCATCHTRVDVTDTLVTPGPGLEPAATHADPVTAALTRAHRLLTPIV